MIVFNPSPCGYFCLTDGGGLILPLELKYKVAKTFLKKSVHFQKKSVQFSNKNPCNPYI